MLEKIIAAHGTADGGRKVVRAEREESEDFLQQAGVNIYELKPEQKKLWVEAVKPINDKLVAAIGGEARRIYGLAREGRKKFRAQAR